MNDRFRAFVFLPDEPTRSGHGPLARLRLAVKDNIDVAGMPTRGASPVFPAVPAKEDAPVVAALRAAGGSIVGKANMHELAFGVTSENEWAGFVANPRFPGHIAGGSSGGTAAAIAAGLVEAGVASDTGGSARIPAAMCGIAGFRPSTGRYSNRGVVLLSEAFDTVGPMGRTAADLELLDAALVARPTSGATDLAGLRLAVPRAYYRDGLEPAVAEAFEVALGRLSAVGCTLVERDVPGLETSVARDHLTVVLHEAERIWRGYADGLGVSLAELAAGIATPRVRGLFEALVAGDAPSASAYAAARERLANVRLAVEGYLAETGADALVAPAAPVTPPARGPRTDGEENAVFDLLTRNMLPATIARQPSACLPIGDDLGIGLLLDGRPGDDERLLALSLAAEAALA